MEFTNNRAGLRKRAGLTQHRLAKITGIPSATISLWENEEVDIDTKLVERIAVAIGEEMNRAPAISAPEDIIRALSPARS
jgi:transcriptional regulator with XRE-family HTH domain